MYSRDLVFVAYSAQWKGLAMNDLLQVSSLVLGGADATASGVGHLGGSERLTDDHIVDQLALRGCETGCHVWVCLLNVEPETHRRNARDISLVLAPLIMYLSGSILHRFNRHTSRSSQFNT